MEVFKSITRGIAEYEGEYIGVNLTNVFFNNPSHIKILIKDYAKEYNISIIWNSEKDKYDSFEKVYLIIFEDVELTETKLKTDTT